MIFVIGDIVRLSDGTYDEVIGFDNGRGAVLGRTGQVGYRTVSIIGHHFDRWDCSDNRVKLFVIGQED